VPITLADIASGDFDSDIKLVLSKTAIFSRLNATEMDSDALSVFFGIGSPFSELYQALKRIGNGFYLNDTVVYLLDTRDDEAVSLHLDSLEEISHLAEVTSAAAKVTFLQLHRLIHSFTLSDTMSNPKQAEEFSYLSEEQRDDLHHLCLHIIRSLLTHTELFEVLRQIGYLRQSYGAVRRQENISRIRLLEKLYHQLNLNILERLWRYHLITALDILKIISFRVHCAITEIPEYQNWLSRLFGFTGFFGSRLRRILEDFQHDYCFPLSPLEADINEVLYRVNLAQKEIKYRYFCLSTQTEDRLPVKIARRLLDVCPIGDGDLEGEHFAEPFINQRVLFTTGELQFNFPVSITEGYSDAPHFFSKAGIERWRGTGRNPAHPLTRSLSWRCRDFTEKEVNLSELYQVINLPRFLSGELSVIERLPKDKNLTDLQLQWVAKLHPMLLDREPIDYLCLLNWCHLEDHVMALNRAVQSLGGIENFRKIPVDFLEKSFLVKLSRIVSTESHEEYLDKLQQLFKRLEHRLDRLANIPSQWLTLERLPFLIKYIEAADCRNQIKSLSCLLTTLGNFNALRRLFREQFLGPQVIRIVHRLSQYTLEDLNCLMICRAYFDADYVDHLPEEFFNIEVMRKVQTALQTERLEGDSLIEYFHSLVNLFRKVNRETFVDMPSDFLKKILLDKISLILFPGRIIPHFVKLKILYQKINNYDVFLSIRPEWLSFDTIDLLLDADLALLALHTPSQAVIYVPSDHLSSQGKLRDAFPGDRDDFSLEICLVHSTAQTDTFSRPAYAISTSAANPFALFTQLDKESKKLSTKLNKMPEKTGHEYETVSHVLTSIQQTAAQLIFS